jgi:tetratricopeptide (TPR) repeat protein
VRELKEGFRLLYVQKYPEARENFSSWISEHPADPFGFVAKAASYLFEEFYRQGVMTSEFFLDDKKFLRGIEGKPDPERMKNFRALLDEARKLSTARLAKDKHDAAALFALTLAAGMESNADSILEKKHLDGLKRMKEANEHAKLLLAQRPDANDAWVAPGSANYIIGCLSGGVRMVLWFGGVHGDKKLGMELVGKTAEKGRYLEPFAKVLLALAARREKQDPLAKKLLHELTEEFPDSPLFAAEYAKVIGRPIPAEIKPD